MGKPTLIVVSGPAGAGKTTLAHALAGAVSCPAVCRDEIKEGMVEAFDREYVAAPADWLTQRASSVFFEVLRLLLEAEVTVVAEAAFQDQVWRPNLERLADSARIRIVSCKVNPTTGRKRTTGRPPRLAHIDASVVGDTDYYDAFVPVSLAAPTIDVDTSDGYEPTFDRIVSFVRGDK
jgi:predicted kinase